MFGNSPFSTGNGFSLSSVLGGISKTLNFANQAIPLYQQVKPLIGNAKGVFDIVKNFTTEKKDNQKKETDEIITTKSVEKIKKENSVTNNPIFFQ